jgi:spore coat protein SA
MVYHLLTDAEPFSEISGGAISRWVANVVRNREEVVVCPSYDSTWHFPQHRVLYLPKYKYLSKIGRLWRYSPALAKRAVLRVIFRPLIDILQHGDIVWVHNRPEFAAFLAPVTRTKGASVVLHMNNSHLRYASSEDVNTIHAESVPLMFCSSFLAEEALATHPQLRARANVLFNGADGQLFHPDEHHSGKRVQIVFAGRLVAEKGVHVLMQAMHLLGERNVPADCSIIGGAGFGTFETTKYVKSLQEQQASNVKLIGYLAGEAYAARIRQADIFCCPSVWQEPFGMVTVEAMASGVPVIATNVGGIPETLQFGGGILIAPDNSEALADAIQMLVADESKRKQLGVDAISAFQHHFAWQNIESEYSAILNAIAK